MTEKPQDPTIDPMVGGDEPLSEADERLLDYLYDELPPDDRHAFERALAADPALSREVEALRTTRQSFARLSPEPMPTGLLDDVLKLAEAEASRAQEPVRPAVADEPSDRAGAAPPSFWQRLGAGLRSLVFQPAFAMATVFLLVGGIALFANRQGQDIPGMGAPTDLQRLPPVAMAPARETAAAPAMAEGAKAVAVAAEDQPLAEAELPSEVAELAVLEAAPRAAPEEGAVPFASASLEAAAAGGVAADADTRARSRGGRMEALGLSDELNESDDFAANGVAARPGASAPASAKPATGATGTASATPSAPAAPKSTSGARGNEGTGTFAPPRPVEVAAAPDPRTPSAEPSAEPARDKLAETQKREETKASERAQPTDRGDADGEAAQTTARPREASPRPVSDTERSETRAPPRKAGIDDLAKDVPPSPPMKTDDARPASPAKASPDPSPTPTPSVERLWTTFDAQMAAGALSDASKTLSELAKLEGESARIKVARERLAEALAASQKRPVDTKPLPEPASVPR